MVPSPFDNRTLVKLEFYIEVVFLLMSTLLSILENLTEERATAYPTRTKATQVYLYVIAEKYNLMCLFWFYPDLGF